MHPKLWNWMSQPPSRGWLYIPAGCHWSLACDKELNLSKFLGKTSALTAVQQPQQRSCTCSVLNTWISDSKGKKFKLNQSRCCTVPVSMPRKLPQSWWDPKVTRSWCNPGFVCCNRTCNCWIFLPSKGLWALISNYSSWDNNLCWEEPFTELCWFVLSIYRLI